MIWPFKTKADKRASAKANATAPALDLSSPDFFADPYPTYGRLYNSNGLPAVTSGGFVLTRHRDIKAALKNPSLGNAPSRFSGLHDRFRDRRVAADVANNILPFLDPPGHSAMRSEVGRAFGRKLRAFMPEIPAIAEEILNRHAATRAVELIAEISSPFATLVMTRFLGLPDAAGPELKQYTESFFRLFAPLDSAEVLKQVNQDLAAFRAFFLRHVDQGQIAETGLLALCPDVENDGAAGRMAFIDNAILIFSDGVENIERGMASILMVLQRNGLLQAPSGLPAPLIAEALRLETPAQIMVRIVRADTQIDGRQLAVGTPVFLALGAANRDATVFENPDVFDAGRDQSEALTFGLGRHSCLGSALAQQMFAALLQGLQNRKVRVPDQDIRYLARVGHRWPEALYINIG